MNLIKKNISYLNYFILLILLISSIGIVNSKNKKDYHDYYTASKLFYAKKNIYQLDLLKGLKENTAPLTFEDLLKPENLAKLDALKGTIGTYIYPPTFAFLLIPISVPFSYEISGLIFELINYSCLILSLFFISKLINVKDFHLLLLLTLLMNYRFIDNHINNNQVVFVLFLLVIYSIYTKSNILSGLLFSLSIVIKITPAIFILYFIYKKRYTVLLWTGLFSIFWILLPSVMGFEYNFSLLMDWKENILDNALKNPVFRSWKNNQSLISTLAKYFSIYADPMNQPFYLLPFRDLSLTTIKIINLILSVSLVSALLYKIYRGLEEHAIISALFILSAVLSGISWVHAFVVLIYPIFYLVNKVYGEPELNRYKILLGIYWFLVIFLNRPITPSFVDNLLMMYSIFLYTSLFLFFIIISIGNKKIKNEI